MTREYAEAKLLRRRLATILNGKMETANREARSKETYDSPSWAYLQADNAGFTRALEVVISLIK
jgi:hypothetical protein